MITPDEFKASAVIKATRNLENYNGQTVVHENYHYAIEEAKDCGSKHCPSRYTCAGLHIRLSTKPLNNTWWCCIDFEPYPCTHRPKKPSRMELLIL